MMTNAWIDADINERAKKRTARKKWILFKFFDVAMVEPVSLMGANDTKYFLIDRKTVIVAMNMSNWVCCR